MNDALPAPAPLRLLLGGDVMLGRLVSRVLAREGADYPLGALRGLIARADLFLVNLECAISASPMRFAGAPKAFYFRAGPEAARVLQSAGIILVSLANNHVLDAGQQGLADTLAILAKHGIASAGAGRNLAEAAAVRSLHCRGQHLGVLAVCDHQEDFAATADSPGIHHLDLRRSSARRLLVEQVQRQAPGFDHLIVSLHWLPNWVPRIPPGYRELAGELVEAGARVLWGHSPHHILGTQLWPGGAAIYSTGDLVDDYALDPIYRNDRQLLYLIELGDTGVERVVAYPVTLDIGRAEPADARARRWIGDWLRDCCRPLGSEPAPESSGGFLIRPMAAGAGHGADGQG